MNPIESQSSAKIIIPAAGLGSRAGSPAAKELLIHPATGRPLIDKSLRLAAQLNITAVVIVREAKTALLEYLKSQIQQGAAIEIKTVSATKEWPDSILQSADLWAERNVLILPDTEFSPEKIVADLFMQLNSVNLAVATFDLQERLSSSYKAQDLNAKIRSYGYFGHMPDGQIVHAEKPTQFYFKNQDVLNPKPWGLLGWRKQIGVALFTQMLESTFDHQWRTVPVAAPPTANTSKFDHIYFSQLDSFADLTRGS